MFSGIGGFEIGIERAYYNKRTYLGKESEQEERKQRGEWIADEPRTLLCSGQNPPLCDGGGGQMQFECIGYSEIDKYAIQCYTRHFPDQKNFGDATKINTDELPNFDFLCGGFPCQAFSIAGKRRGFEDTRGTLFFEIARILKAKRPSYILLENVKGLLNHSKGQTFFTIIQTLDELGYDTQWLVLNSKFHGVPQNRERVFIVGNIRGQPRPEILPFGESSKYADEKHEQETSQSQTITSTYWKGGKGTHLKEITDNIPDAQRIYSIDGISKTLKGQGGGQGAKTGLYDVSIMDLYDHTESSEVCPTLKDPCHNDRRVREGTKIRRLTPIECERLQGFEDNYTKEGIDEKGEIVQISDSQRYKCLGNAVTVNVIQAIMERFIEVNQ